MPRLGRANGLFFIMPTVLFHWYVLCKNVAKMTESGITDTGKLAVTCGSLYDIFLLLRDWHRYGNMWVTLVHPSVCPSFRPSVRLSIRLSVGLSVRPSVRLSVHPSIRPSVAHFLSTAEMETCKNKTSRYQQHCLLSFHSYLP